MVMWDPRRVSLFIVNFDLCLTHPWARSVKWSYGIPRELAPLLSAVASAQLTYGRKVLDGHVGSLEG